MTDAERIREELEELSALLASSLPSAGEPWSAAWLNRQSLLTRQVEVQAELKLVEGLYEFEVALTGTPVVGNAVEARFLGSFLEELQLTVSSVVQTIMHGVKKYGALGNDVLGASTMRLQATAPGSFVLAFAPRARSVQLPFEGSTEEDEPRPAFDEAIERILDLLDAAENEVAGELLPTAVAELGGPRATKHMLEVAHILASHQAAARATSRSPFLAEWRTASLSGAGAHRLEVLLGRTEQRVERLALVGRLSGVRWKNTSFDLEVEEGSTPLTGKIARDLRDDVRELFDRVVRATVERTTIQSQIEAEERVTYRLVEVEPGP